MKLEHFHTRKQLDQSTTVKTGAWCMLPMLLSMRLFMLLHFDHSKGCDRLLQTFAADGQTQKPHCGAGTMATSLISMRADTTHTERSRGYPFKHNPAVKTLKPLLCK